MDKNDIILAVKNADKFLNVSTLKGASVKLKSNGQPYFFTGGFTMVFQLTKNNENWAFRVWHTVFNQQKKRFQKISKYLSKQQLSYFADFIYDEKGLVVNGESVDTIRMKWLEGNLLKDYIEKNLNDKQKIQDLADSFLTMCETLHNHKISHGDLQHGNILIDNHGSIKLIDYDSVCVPDIEGKEELVAGLKGYQHPSRFAGGNQTTPTADYFSELVIYLSLCALAENSQLWSKFKVKDTEVLLFSPEDYENIQQSEIYKTLLNLNSDKIERLLDILVIYLKEKSYLDLQPFGSYLQPPEIIGFSANKDVIVEGQKITLSWNVKNAQKIEIDNGIGHVNSNGSISIVPKWTCCYKIKATGFSGKEIVRELTVRIFPTPIIESLQVPMPDFESRINLNPIKISSPKIDVSINIPELNLNLLNCNFDMPKFTALETDLSKIKPQYKSKVLINFSKIYGQLKAYRR